MRGQGAATAVRNPAPFLPDSPDWYGIRHKDEEETETPRKTNAPKRGYRTAASRKRAGRKRESESALEPTPIKRRRRRK